MKFKDKETYQKAGIDYTKISELKMKKKDKAQETLV